jgi:hypothetical protein
MIPGNGNIIIFSSSTYKWQEHGTDCSRLSNGGAKYDGAVPQYSTACYQASFIYLFFVVVATRM